MESLSNDVIRLIMTYLIPEKHCLVAGPPKFTAYLCVDKYVSEIKVKKVWTKCTNEKILDRQLCVQHSENYKDWKKIGQILQRLNGYADHYIHFDTKKQAQMAKSYLKNKLGYRVVQESCCSGKGFLLAKD